MPRSGYDDALRAPSDREGEVDFARFSPVACAVVMPFTALAHVTAELCCGAFHSFGRSLLATGLGLPFTQLQHVRQTQYHGQLMKGVLLDQISPYAGQIPFG